MKKNIAIYVVKIYMHQELLTNQELPIHRAISTRETTLNIKNNRLIVRKLYVIGHSIIVWFLVIWFVLEYALDTSKVMLFSAILTFMLMGTAFVLAHACSSDNNH